jgi:hypothetical protein
MTDEIETTTNEIPLQRLTIHNGVETASLGFLQELPLSKDSIELMLWL